LRKPVLKKFEYVEHTADLGLKAYGETLENLFSNAAEALFEVMVSVETIQARQSQVIEVNAPSLDDLMVCWLNELLYTFDTERFLFRRYEIEHLDPSFIKAKAFGEPLDPSRHVTKTGIKAVTYHRPYVRQKDGGWECQVLLDL
jgi:SHS2 domain-containing protein